MKKFQFPLNTVLTYKTQILDSLRGEHAAILAQVRRQEEVLESLQVRYYTHKEEYNQQQREGLTIAEALIYQSGLHALERDIDRENERLEEYRKQESQKRNEVVEAKKETASIEKLKEKKLDLYKKAVQKNEEAFIDDFVSTARITRMAEK